jgi:toxin ParE1/3/4
MPTLRFARSARDDLLDILDFIARDKPIAAARWIDTIQEKCELIARTPEIGHKRPEYGPDIRSSTVGRYVIFYRPTADGIEVIRVIAGERDIKLL